MNATNMKPLHPLAWGDEAPPWRAPRPIMRFVFAHLKPLGRSVKEAGAVVLMLDMERMKR